jgi:hypothetical protein
VTGVADAGTEESLGGAFAQAGVAVGKR